MLAMVAETGISTTYETIPKLQTSQAGSRLSAVNSNRPKVVHHGSDDKEACREIKRDPAVLLSVARADSQRGHITHHPSAMLTLLRGGVGGVGGEWRHGEREKEGGSARSNKLMHPAGISTWVSLSSARRRRTAACVIFPRLRASLRLKEPSITAVELD